MEFTPLQLMVKIFQVIIVVKVVISLIHLHVERKHFLWNQVIDFL